MDAIALYKGFAPVVLCDDFEALIKGQTAKYEYNVPTKGTDVLHVAAYVLHKWENAVVRTNSGITFTEMPAKGNAPEYIFAKAHGMAIHLTGGLKSNELIGPVTVELRVKVAEPTNRPEFDEETGEENVVKRSYEFVLEVSPGTSSEKTGNLFIERAGAPDAVVLNANRNLWVNRGVCVKAVPDGYVPPTKTELRERAGERGRSRDDFRHDRDHHGEFGGYGRGGGRGRGDFNRW